MSIDLKEAFIKIREQIRSHEADLVRWEIEKTKEFSKGRNTVELAVDDIVQAIRRSANACTAILSSIEYAEEVIANALAQSEISEKANDARVNIVIVKPEDEKNVETKHEDQGLQTEEAIIPSVKKKKK